MLVLDVVADDDLLALADGEIVEVGARIELGPGCRRRWPLPWPAGAEAAVTVSDRAIVDVGVVGEHVDQDRPRSRRSWRCRGLATGPSLVPVTVMVIVEEDVAPCSSSMS